MARQEFFDKTFVGYEHLISLGRRRCLDIFGSEGNMDCKLALASAEGQETYL